MSPSPRNMLVVASGIMILLLIVIPSPSHASVLGTSLMWRVEGTTIKYRFQDKSACDAMPTTFAPVTESKTSAITRAMTAWTNFVPTIQWQEVQSGEQLLIMCDQGQGMFSSSYMQAISIHEESGTAMLTYAEVHLRPLGGAVIAEHELGHVLGLPDNPPECVAEKGELMCSITAGGGIDMPVLLKRMQQDLIAPSPRETQELRATYITPPPPQALFFIEDVAGNEVQVPQGGSVRVLSPVSFKIKAQSSTVTWRVLVDSIPYPMAEGGHSGGSAEWIFATAPIPMSVGTHNVRFEYQTTGSSWAPLAILTLEGTTEIVGSNIIVPSIVGLAVVTVVVLIWHRRHGEGN